MKKLFSVMAMAMLILSVMPVVLGNDVGVGIGLEIITEDFEPKVYQCDNRVVSDDNTEPGRITTVLGCSGATDTLALTGASETENENQCNAVGGTYDSGPNGDPANDTCTEVPFDNQSDCEANGGVWSTVERITERLQNYAFEGEQVTWEVVVFDKNGIEKISDVFATVGDVQGAGNDIEVNCVFNQDVSTVDESCNARIDEEEIGTVTNPFPDNTAASYTCTLTVETPDSHYGEYWVTVEAEDLDGLSGTMDENEYWFLNPVIALSVDGDLEFDNVRPGTHSYSQTLLVGNDADDGSGVRLDMFISGTDFYDSSSSGAKCPTTNQLSLSAFDYHATNGAYSTADDSRADPENYVPIGYATGFNNPNPFYDAYEIIKTTTGTYSDGNVLTPGSELAITFRLDLPEPCNGDFDTGTINFWGEAI